MVSAGEAKPLQYHHHLPHNIGLMLKDGCVADSKRFGVGQMRELLFRQVTFALYACIICSSSGSPASARTIHLRHFKASNFVAVRQHGFELQGCIAQPTVAVVPVAWSAKLLGQGSGRSGDNASRFHSALKHVRPEVNALLHSDKALCSGNEWRRPGLRQC